MLMFLSPQQAVLRGSGRVVVLTVVAVALESLRRRRFLLRGCEGRRLRFLYYPTKAKAQKRQFFSPSFFLPFFFSICLNISQLMYGRFPVAEYQVTSRLCFVPTRLFLFGGAAEVGRLLLIRSVRASFTYLKS